MSKSKRKDKGAVEFPLKSVLERYGWSQRKLARSLAMDYNRINDLANGRHLPGWATVVKIATTLGADLGDFQLGQLPPPAKKPRTRKPRARAPVDKLAPVTAEG